MRVAWTVILVAACTGAGPSPQLVQRTDTGVVCVRAAAADQVAPVEVYSGDCLSSSCDRKRQGSCTAALDGTTITVTSSFSWERATASAICTTDCGTIRAECEVGPLPAGTYSVVHGGKRESLTVPTSVECGR